MPVTPHRAQGAHRDDNLAAAAGRRAGSRRDTDRAAAGPGREGATRRAAAVAVRVTTRVVLGGHAGHHTGPAAPAAEAHMGVLFGPVNQFLLAAVALGLLGLIVWGYRMWWQRRPTGTARLAAAPAPGAWRRLPTPLLALAVVAVAAIGWALPVLGGSLALFLLLDATAAPLRRIRRRHPPSPAPAIPEVAGPRP